MYLFADPQLDFDEVRRGTSDSQLEISVFCCLSRQDEHTSPFYSSVAKILAFLDLVVDYAMCPLTDDSH